MLDKYKRNINYLRISVTDRCNLRCVYCMPEQGVQLMAHDDIMSFEQIYNFVKQAVKEGITKIRITGGEPLVRKGIVDLISMISSIKEVDDLAMTTNGILLEQYAHKLVKAGLDRVNISLDTLNPIRYSKITRGGDINRVIRGIEAARKAGLDPIKINCVRMKDTPSEDIDNLKRFCKERNLPLRFIHQMDLSTGEFSVVEGGDGGNCSQCNRIRLTANGKVKPCLFNSKEFDVLQLGVIESLKQAIKSKPRQGTRNNTGSFFNIGG